MIKRLKNWAVDSAFKQIILALVYFAVCFIIMVALSFVFDEQFEKIGDTWTSAIYILQFIFYGICYKFLFLND